MKRIYLALAFDHELSLGGVRTSYADNLFEPTDALLGEAGALGVPLTLFTDVLSGVRFRNWGIREFYEPYERQLQDSLRLGHDVQLHLHPHWLETQMSEGRFEPSSRYSLADFESEEPPRNIPGIVETGVRYLDEVCRPAKADYRCIAFRAGGFCIQRAAPAILRALWENGIRIDSSVPPGFRFRSDIYDVDFSSAPRLGNWRLGLDGTEGATADDSLYEVPIATIPRTPLNNLAALAKRVAYRSRGRPSSGVPLYDVDVSYVDKLKRLFPFSAWMLSFDFYYVSPRYLLSLLDQYIRARPESEAIFVSTVSHPKEMGPSNLELMRGFVQAARTAYGNSLNFCTFDEICRLSSEWT